jgi:hypothetical protein
MSQRCSRSVYVSGTFKGRQCTREGLHLEDGKFYCKQHLPSNMDAKRKERNAAWDAKWKAEREATIKQQDERAELERRAACYPDLLAACEELVEAIDTCISMGQGGPFSRHCVPTLKTLRAAIAKANGGTNGNQ